MGRGQYGTWDGTPGKAVGHYVGYLLGGNTPSNLTRAKSVMERIRAEWGGENGYPDGTVRNWLTWGHQYQGASESPKSPSQIRSKGKDGKTKVSYIPTLCYDKAVRVAVMLGFSQDEAEAKAAKCPEKTIGRASGAGRTDPAKVAELAAKMPDPASIVVRPRTK